MPPPASGAACLSSVSLTHHQSCEKKSPIWMSIKSTCLKSLSQYYKLKRFINQIVHVQHHYVNINESLSFCSDIKKRVLSIFIYVCWTTASWTFTWLTLFASIATSWCAHPAFLTVRCQGLVTGRKSLTMWVSYRRKHKGDWPTQSNHILFPLV